MTKAATPSAPRRAPRKHYRQPRDEVQLDRQRCREYGERVKENRVAAGMTQAELGKAINKSVSQVSNIENGVNWSDMPVYRRLCELFSLGVPPLMK